MQAILKHLAESGYLVSDIVPDSRLHRFKRNPQDKDKDAWYVCHQSHSRAGELFYIIIFGDWREGGFNKFNTLVGANQDDISYIQKQIEKAQQERDQEQSRLWEEASIRSAQEWEGFLAAVPDNKYLNRKKVRAFGIRSQDEALIVPVRDRSGKFWGYQRITDTEKKFSWGAKLKGNFHVIGVIKEQALLCEGYATGASLYEATNIPVIIAFNAGNLPAVASQFHDIRLTVCGDDDQFKAENAGRKHAEKCGASKVIYPKFKNLDTKPTDFNDLHVLEGLEEVKKQILGDKTPRQYILPLGHSGEDYYYTSSSNRQIVRIPRGQHSKSILLDLMPMAYWEARFPGATGTNWSAAADFLMGQCRVTGIYDEENIRGIGVWKDAGRYVVNLGDSLYTNERLQLDDFKTNFIYEIGKKIQEPSHANVDTNILCSLIDKVSFKHPDSKIYFLGFLTVAPVAGALDWRPHIWLNGGSNTGKSTIMQVVSQIFGPYKHYFQGQTTEAGIRQTTRNDSKPVMFDEFEADELRGQERLQLILELVRQASSETDGHVAKGSPGGNAVTARPKFSAMFSSIRIPQLNEADRTRITDLELEWLKDADKFDEFKRLALLIDQDYSNAYFSRTLRLMPVLQETINIFWDVLRRKHSARIGQQYGALISGAWIARNDTVVTKEEAQAVCDKLELGDAKQNLVNREEIECLEHLCNSLIFMEGGTRRSIRELIETEATAMLGRYGILRDEDRVYVASSHAEIKKLFKDTRWASGWGKSLARLQGAEKKSKYIGGKTIYSVGFPLDLVLEYKD